MSYDIVYEQLALRVPWGDVKQQAYDFLKNCVPSTDIHRLSDINQTLYTRYRFTVRNEDIYVLFMLIGSSNLFDTETNKRSRSWQFCGVSTYQQLLIKYGCDWSAMAESGELKLNGRDTKAEGWIRTLRQILHNAKGYDIMPYCHYLKVWLKSPADELKENQLAELKTQLSDLNPIWQEQMRFDEQGFNVEIAPKSVFEMWLFQQLITGYQDKCWFNGSEPPSFAVKKLSI